MWSKLPVDIGIIRGAGSWLAFNGKLYVILLDEIEIINVTSLLTGNVEVTNMDKPIEFSTIGNGLDEHLVESCGNIFFVRISFWENVDNCVFDVTGIEIYKLDFEKENPWMRVESIGDSAFLLDEYGGQSCCAEDAQLNQDCVYYMFSCRDVERFCKICLKDQTISLNSLPATSIHYGFYWILPVRRPILKHELLTSSETIARSPVCKKSYGLVREHENKKSALSMQSSHLPIEMVQLISEKLPFKDSMRLQAVCKLWSEQLPNPTQNEVLLMFCPKKCGACQMYNPQKGEQFTLNLKKLSSSNDAPTRFLSSKDGWVLAIKGFDLICLLNPFSNEFHQLPRLKDHYSYNGIAFSCAPKNSFNCVVFAVVGPNRKSSEFIAWHYGQEKWLEMKFQNNLPFHVADNNPVFFDGEFYCLGRKGNLGVFNPEKNTWRVLDKPSPIYSGAVPDIGTEYCYLLECNGELISVFRATNMDYVRVFKLDRSKMAWNLLDDLGNLTLFLDYRSSIAKTLSCKSFSNKLYVPRLHNETNEATFYYCMKTQMHNPDVQSLREPYNCVWLETQLQ